MDINQRKEDLINWIKELDNESILMRIEAYRKAYNENIPSEILQLLECSNQTNDKELKIHTTSRDLLKK